MKHLAKLSAQLHTAVSVYKDNIFCLLLILFGTVLLFSVADSSVANVTTVGAGYEHDRLNKTDDNEDFYNEVK